MTPPATPNATKVSVVVPVYNTEAFLAQCLDSLVKQTLDDIEIVVVNDGSPDGSQAIIDRFTRLYPDKIVPLAQPNGGLGSARNLGIAHAHGRYIGFVDSDDFVEPEMYQRLYEEAERTGSDVAICRYRHYSLDGSYDVVGGNFPFAEGERFPSEGFFLNSRVMIVVNKIYRAELVRRVPFQDTWFEDVAWSPVAMSYADSICYTPGIYYHYIQREGTITMSHDDGRTLQEVSSLRHALTNANPERIHEVAFMAARRLLFDAQIRPAYADKFALALHEFRDLIAASPHVLDDAKLYLRIWRFLEEDFETIPKTVLFSARARPEDPESSWRDAFAFPADTNYVDVDSWEAPDDEVAARLAARPKALRDYLQLAYLHEHGGIVLGDELSVVGPIAWALHASRSFFGFEGPGRVSTQIFGAVPGAQVVGDLLAFFRDRVDAPDPLAAAFDAYFVESGRAVWGYEEVEANFDAPYLELPGSCRVYATSAFVNDFGLDLATTALYPAAVADAEGEVLHYLTSPAHREVARRIGLDYAAWAGERRKPAPAAPAVDPAPSAAPTAPEAQPDKPAAKAKRGRGPAARLARLRRRVLRRLTRKTPPTPKAPVAPPQPPPAPAPAGPPRPLEVRDPAIGLRALLFVGGFTTSGSAERARAIAAWLRAAHGAGVDIRVLFTDRGDEDNARRARTVRNEGLRLLSWTPADGPREDPADLSRRVLGDEHFDLLIVATPVGGGIETSLLGAALSGTRVLCRMGQKARRGRERPFDVVLDRLPELRQRIAEPNSHR